MHDKQVLIEHYQQMRSDLLRALDGLSDDQLSERTLDGWSVKDHLAHVVLWDELRAAEIERISAGLEPAWSMNEDQVNALNEINHSLRADHSIAQIRWEIERTLRLIIAAISAATDRGLEQKHYGEPGIFSDHEAEHTGWILAWREKMGY